MKALHIALLLSGLFNLVNVSVASAASSPQIGCYDLAVNHRLMTPEAAIKLCRGAKSNEPLHCFDAMTSRNLDAFDKISLCSGAEDQSVVACFDLSLSRKLTLYQALVLCAHKNAL